MGLKKQKKFFTVAPFECAWRKELRFRDAGRGCVTFEAFAHNDVTVVFREHAASQHYHYRMDNTPNYTVILGSHRNRRLKIEVDGKTVVDVAGIGLCCSSSFQSYWISIYDGLISIGKGHCPFQNVVFQWLDAEPNRKVQYVGLSSWDKHVGYRNITVLPSQQIYDIPQRHIEYYNSDEDEDDDDEDGDDDVEEIETYEEWGLKNFLESWDLSDMLFLVGPEKKAVPAHKIILDSAGNFGLSSSNESEIRLPSVPYLVLHSILEFIYTGQTQILESQLGSLRDLSEEFQVMPLVKQCEDTLDHIKMNEMMLDSCKTVEIVHSRFQAHRNSPIFPCELPIDVPKLKQLFSTGKHSDVDIYIAGHGIIAHPHKLVLSLWSAPFTKMFTNGMSESNSSEICFRDVSAEAFLAMLQFMYTGELELDKAEMSSLLLPLLLLADQFGIRYLHQECCKNLLECLSEDSVCPILQVISSMPMCKLLEEMCEKNFSMHFDYCTTASTEFVLLDEPTFMKVLQHPDLTVTSEEKVLDAILMWGMKAREICGWESVDELLMSTTPDLLFEERHRSIDILLPLVRFPLMQLTMLKTLEKSNLSNLIPVFQQLIKEAIKYSDIEIIRPGNDQKFQHRRSSFKELQYICDGDKNGVMYYTGTSYGQHQWVNPYLAKKIAVTASSPASRYTDPKVLVSRTYQATSFAGPRIEDGKNCAWWKVDIGQDHQLMCNYYTLRQDGSTAYPRWWALQGSLGGQNWTTLRVHENDQTICKPGQFASWPIHGPSALLPFRFFRVVLTGPTTGDSNLCYLCICFLELYGYFH